MRGALCLAMVAPALTGDFGAPGGMPVGAACGKVYIYDLPEALYDLPWRPAASPGFDAASRVSASPGVETIFGNARVKKAESCEGLDGHAFESLYATHQWGAAEQLLYRAATSLRCPRTLDPKEADVFLIPVLPRANVPCCKQRSRLACCTRC